VKDQTHEDLKSNIAPYVLGALPSEEIPSFRAHLTSCDECRAEVDELSKTARSLALSVEPVDPPSGFTRSILDRVAEERAEAATPSRALRSRRPLLAFLAAGMAVLAVVLGAIALDARGDAEANRRVAAALLQNSDGMEMRGEAGVEAKVVPGENGAVFVATGLDDLPDDRSYQLWFLKDGSMVSAGVFDVSEGVALLRTSRSTGGVEGAAVTVEPSGGSRQPTTDPVIESA
jgi:anti-sigma-K factor RskA